MYNLRQYNRYIPTTTRLVNVNAQNEKKFIKDDFKLLNYNVCFNVFQLGLRTPDSLLKITNNT